MTGKHTELTAQFLPSGDALVNKNYEGSNLRKFVEAYSEEFKRLNDLMSTFNKEYDPSTTTLFLSNWESAIKSCSVCMPNVCSLTKIFCCLSATVSLGDSEEFNETGWGRLTWGTAD